MAKLLYSQQFYENQRDGSLASAQRMVPELLQLIPARSVIDVGCGTGTWLSVFSKLGVNRVVGVDGDYVKRDMLQIPQQDFVPCDLSKPLDITERFDLVLSVEVAEHLHEKYARQFIEQLTKLGPVVMFGAAIPLQGGRHHVNEQWPSYWISIFNDLGYQVIDCIRDRFWDDDMITTHYIQNTFVFVEKGQIEKYPALLDISKRQTNPPQMKVHPRFWQGKISKLKFKLENRLGRRIESALKGLFQRS